MAQNEVELKNSVIILNSKEMRAKNMLEVLKQLRNQSDYEFYLPQSLDEAKQVAKMPPFFILVFVVSRKEDLVQMLYLLEEIKKIIKSDLCKVIGYNYLNQKVVEDALRKKGVLEFLYDNLPAKSLSYKFNLMFRALHTNYNKMLKSSQREQVKTFSANIDLKNNILFKAPINKNHEAWGINSKKDFSIFQGMWEIDIKGPSEVIGEWKKNANLSTAEAEVWDWYFSPEARCDFLGDVAGVWRFKGERPNYIAATDAWKFRSTKPELGYHGIDSEVIDWKLSVNKQELIVSKNSRILANNLIRFKQIASNILLGRGDVSGAQLINKGIDEISTYEKGETELSENLDDMMAGKTEMSADDIATQMEGAINSSADTIDDKMRGTLENSADSLQDLQGKGGAANEYEDLMGKGATDHIAGQYHGSVGQSAKSDQPLKGKNAPAESIEDLYGSNRSDAKMQNTYEGETDTPVEKIKKYWGDDNVEERPEGDEKSIGQKKRRPLLLDEKQDTHDDFSEEEARGLQDEIKNLRENSSASFKEQDLDGFLRGPGNETKSETSQKEINIADLLLAENDNEEKKNDLAVALENSEELSKSDLVQSSDEFFDDRSIGALSKNKRQKRKQSRNFIDELAADLDRPLDEEEHAELSQIQEAQVPTIDELDGLSKTLEERLFEDGAQQDDFEDLAAELSAVRQKIKDEKTRKRGLVEAKENVPKLFDLGKRRRLQKKIEQLEKQQRSHYRKDEGGAKTIDLDLLLEQEGKNHKEMEAAVDLLLAQEDQTLIDVKTDQANELKIDRKGDRSSHEMTDELANGLQSLVESESDVTPDLEKEQPSGLDGSDLPELLMPGEISKYRKVQIKDYEQPIKSYEEKERHIARITTDMTFQARIYRVDQETKKSLGREIVIQIVDFFNQFMIVEVEKKIFTTKVFGRISLDLEYLEQRTSVDIVGEVVDVDSSFEKFEHITISLTPMDVARLEILKKIFEKRQSAIDEFLIEVRGY